MAEREPFASKPPDLPGELYVFSTGQDVHQASLDDYDPGLIEPWSWTGQAGIKKGAYLLLYVAYPISSFCWIGRACSGSERPASALGRSCLFVELHPLEHPLSLAEARAHPVIGQWKLIVGRGGLEGSSRRVKQPEVWDAAMAELCDRNPGLADLLTRWQSEPPPSPSGDLEDFFWEAALDGTIRFAVSARSRKACASSSLSSSPIARPSRAMAAGSRTSRYAWGAATAPTSSWSPRRNSNQASS